MLPSNHHRSVIRFSYKQTSNWLLPKSFLDYASSFKTVFHFFVLASESTSLPYLEPPVRSSQAGSCICFSCYPSHRSLTAYTGLLAYKRSCLMLWGFCQEAFTRLLNKYKGHWKGKKISFIMLFRCSSYLALRFSLTCCSRCLRDWPNRWSWLQNYGVGFSHSKGRAVFSHGRRVSEN